MGWTVNVEGSLLCKEATRFGCTAPQKTSDVRRGARASGLGRETVAVSPGASGGSSSGPPPARPGTARHRFVPSASSHVAPDSSRLDPGSRLRSQLRHVRATRSCGTMGSPAAAPEPACINVRVTGVTAAPMSRSSRPDSVQLCLCTPTPVPILPSLSHLGSLSEIQF